MSYMRWRYSVTYEMKSHLSIFIAQMSNWLSHIWDEVTSHMWLSIWVLIWAIKSPIKILKWAMTQLLICNWTDLLSIFISHVTECPHLMWNYRFLLQKSPIIWEIKSPIKILKWAMTQLLIWAMKILKWATESLTHETHIRWRYWSLLQNIVSLIGLFCKRNL